MKLRKFQDSQDPSPRLCKHLTISEGEETFQEASFKLTWVFSVMTLPLCGPCSFKWHQGSLALGGRLRENYLFSLLSALFSGVNR